MEFRGSAMNESCITGENGSGGRVGDKRLELDDSQFKSPNLIAERKRRKKLSDRLLALRALVPIITNMNKETIIVDAIAYIEELQRNVEDLSDQIHQMEASRKQETKTVTDEIDATEDMKQYGIKEDLQVTNIDGNKLWIKIVIEKKRGRFSRLMEAVTYLGMKVTDVSVTTSKGAFLISSCVEGAYGDTLTVEQTKELLLEIIRGI